MSEKTIFDQLVKLGMTSAGACGMIGNFWAESGLRADNLQDSYARSWGITDAEYCRLVNAGMFTHGSKGFAEDGAGFGLWQATARDRKAGLLAVCKQWGTVIEDEELQVWYACYELAEQYFDLWTFLCTTDDYKKAADRLCAEWERPAFNNYAVRERFAAEAYERLVVNTPKSETSVSDFNTDLEKIIRDLSEILNRLKSIRR